MKALESKINAFFTAYAQRFNDGLAAKEPDVEGTTVSFADCFIEASPAGITCGKNDRKFRKMIPKGYAFYRKIGTQEMRIKRIEIMELDALHVMARVSWHSTYKKADAAKLIAIDFDVIYLLQLKEEGPKIFAYVTGDEQKVLKEKRLV